ncbi:MAG: hypothetical protein L3K05_03290, partial [Thermoplasmata archaeon]|nr:hypothetical protein [Thermoplasmata archaeon]
TNHTYLSPGSYSTRFLATDASNTTVLSNTTVVLVHGPPPALLSAVDIQPDPVLVGTRAVFSLQAPGADPPLSVRWTVGSLWGCTDLANVSVTCDPLVPGSFSVSANATDGVGRQTNATATFVVQPYPLRATLTASPYVSSLGDTISWSANLSGGEPPYLLAWLDLPAGCNRPVGANLVCRPPVAGTYRLTVEVNDSSGQLAPVFASATAVVLGPQGTTPVGGTKLGEFSAGFVWLLVIGAGAGGALAGIATMVWVRRRSGGRPRPPPRIGPGQS